MRTKTDSQSEKILGVAAKLFAAHRFHEARMEDIAAAAGVGKGTLYRYFHDKEALYLALLSQAQEGMTHRLGVAATGPGGPRQRLEATVAAILSYLDEQPHVFDLILHAEALQRPGKTFPWMKTRREAIARIIHLFEEGALHGEFRVEDADLAVLMLLGGVRAVYRFGKKPRPRKLARDIVTCFLEGAGANPTFC